MIIKKVLIPIIIITLLFALQDVMATVSAKRNAHIFVPSSAAKSMLNTGKPASTPSEQNNATSSIAIHPTPNPDGYSVSVSSVPVK